MGIEWMGRAVWMWAESAQRSSTEDMEGGIVVGEARWLTVDDPEPQEEEIDCAGRHRRTQSAETPKTFVMSIVVSCGNRDRKRRGAELDFGSRESCDDFHRPIALGANPKIARTGGGDLWLGLWC
jgi:hypothetical protein